eukprot:767047-Hanusia_phi.AAC.1
MSDRLDGFPAENFIYCYGCWSGYFGTLSDADRPARVKRGLPTFRFQPSRLVNRVKMASSSPPSSTPSRSSPRLRVRAASPSAYELHNFSKEYELRDGVPRLSTCPRYGSREGDEERQYNGESGVIIGRKRSHWVVKLDIMPHGASIHVSPDNVKHDLGLKNAEVLPSSTPVVPRGGEVSVPGFIHPSARRRFSKSEEDEALLNDLSPRTKKLLSKGNRVQLKELVNKPELNWRFGTIVDVEDGVGDQHKCIVALDDGNVIKVKSRNLIPKGQILVDTELQSAQSLRHELNACTAHIAERTRRINNGLDPDEQQQVPDPEKRRRSDQLWDVDLNKMNLTGTNGFASPSHNSRAESPGKTLRALDRIIEGCAQEDGTGRFLRILEMSEDGGYVHVQKFSVSNKVAGQLRSSLRSCEEGCQKQ